MHSGYLSKWGSNGRVVAAVRFDNQMRADVRNVQFVEKRPTAALLVGIERKLIDAVPPGVIGRGRIEIDFDAPVDIVAITTWTMNSIRAYEIADRFRKRGVTVLMGGPHTFFHYEEASAHCDAVAAGEGETIWPLMLSDAAAGKLKKFYRADKPHSLENLSLPRYDLINLKQYDWFKTYSVQTSRGCPFRCEFCSERLYLGHHFRYRPTQDVIEEIKHTKAKDFLFADSNFGGNVAHAMELMEALLPLKVRWSALWSSYLCHDTEFMDKGFVFHRSLE